jgi:hypothetical protein
VKPRTATEIPQVNQAQGESTMSELDDITNKLKADLKGIKNKYTLEEWRYAYANIIYAGAMRILGEFPDIVTGLPPARPAPPPEQRGPANPEPASFGAARNPRIDGERPPYHPNVCPIVCMTLGNCPPPPTQ